MPHVSLCNVDHEWLHDLFTIKEGDNKHMFSVTNASFSIVANCYHY